MPDAARTLQVYAITGKLLLAILHDFLEVSPGLDATDFSLALGVALGYFEKRPLTHTKLAVYVGLPRATVVRRVKRLVELRVLQYAPDGKTIQTPRDRLVGGRGARLSVKYARHIQIAAGELSKMDT